MNPMSHIGVEFPEQTWIPFAESGSPLLCKRGHLIYRQGTPATHFYFLKRGRVKSFMRSASGEERILNTYKAGNLFGEVAFFDELPRVSSAVALTPCEIVEIDRTTVSRLIGEDPKLALALMKYLALTVRIFTAQVDQMAFHPARWRVAHYLMTRSRDGSTVFCTQEEIASSISVSRVTVNHILREFTHAGITRLDYGQIHLLDIDALSSICLDEN